MIFCSQFFRNNPLLDKLIKIVSCRFKIDIFILSYNFIQNKRWCIFWFGVHFLNVCFYDCIIFFWMCHHIQFFQYNFKRTFFIQTFCVFLGHLCDGCVVNSFPFFLTIFVNEIFLGNFLLVTLHLLFFCTTEFFL